MYERFFGLGKNPFLMTPDPAFLFMTESHREALAGLTYGVMNRKGFLVLIGGAGTGKTTLLRAVVRNIPATRAEFAFILNPTLTTAEFIEFMMLDFGIPIVPESKAQRLISMQRFFMQAYKAGKTCVLVVDEAHRLGPEVLEEIRLLANFETAGAKLLQIVLAGQDELRDVLNRQDLRQVKQRIGLRLAIQPLSAREIGPYLRHRWARSEATGIFPFEPDAVREIGVFSQGVPRVVNAICDNALLLAYGTGVNSIDAGLIWQVAAEFDLVHLRDEGKTRDSHSVNAAAAETIARAPAPVERSAEAESEPVAGLERHFPKSSVFLKRVAANLRLA